MNEQVKGAVLQLVSRHVKTQRTCFHEAGHAVAAIAGGCKIKSITATPTNEYVGQCKHHQGPKGVDLCRKTSIESNILLAGLEVEAIQYKTSIELLSMRGHTDLKMWKELDDFLSLEQRAIVVRSLLYRYWPAVTALAAALFNRDEVTGEEAFTIATSACPALLKMHEAEAF